MKMILQRFPTLWRAARRFRATFKEEKREPEFALLPFLVPRHMTAIDIGANIGLYTEALLKIASSVIAIEPNPDYSERISRLYGDKVKVIPAAASNETGRATLRIPTEPYYMGLATIEKSNPLTEANNAVKEIEVATFTLDSLALDNVGFIKIDVEGHEDAVLQGATDTLTRNRPTLLIEAEERRRSNAVHKVRKRLEALGYVGYSFHDGALSSITNLDSEKSRSSDGCYTYNFIFIAS